MAYVSSIERIGIEKGVLQGVVQGESRLLRKLLKQRFGTLPAWVLDKISSAPADDLERWAEALLFESSLEAVFNDSAMH
ncbi:MAG: DUF4351 domain-containing protein [Methylobacter sp.]|nr:DUF4351 domain-containing protein [Methylobacter sp.]